MTKNIGTFLTVATVLITACQSKYQPHNAKTKDTLAVARNNEKKWKAIPFTEAKNYFVKNTVTTLNNPTLQTAETFNNIFGMATTMGKEGKPTNIDFTNQYVIAVILPETNLTTTVVPLSLKKDEKGTIVLTYKTIVAQKQSFTTRPTLQIIVNKTENGNVEIKEQQ